MFSTGALASAADLDAGVSGGTQHAALEMPCRGSLQTQADSFDVAGGPYLPGSIYWALGASTVSSVLCGLGYMWLNTRKLDHWADGGLN